MRRLCLGLLLAGLAATVPARSIERDLSDSALDEAIVQARRASEAERLAFHRGYVFPTGSTPITSVSVVTEFRRVVIAAEDRALFGDRMWGMREAREVLRQTRNTLEMVAQVDFHPQNAYVTVPQYNIRLVPKEGPEIRALSVQITAKYGLKSVPSPTDPPYYPFPPPGLPAGPGADPLMGAWVSATFDATPIDPRMLMVVAVSEGTKDLARVSVDLGRLR